jgi:hypothetical protein
MNMHVTSRDVRTIAEQIANRKAVMARVYGPMKITNVMMNPQPGQPVIERLIMATPTDEELQQQFKGQPEKLYLYKRCVALGVRYNEVLSKRKGLDMCRIRKSLIIEMRETFGMTYERLAELFDRKSETIAEHIKGKRIRDRRKNQENAA